MHELSTVADAEGHCAFLAGVGFVGTVPEVADVHCIFAPFALDGDAERDEFEKFDAVEFEGGE